MISRNSIDIKPLPEPDLGSESRIITGFSTDHPKIIEYSARSDFDGFAFSFLGDRLFLDCGSA
jgi:hypothetical protein